LILSECIDHLEVTIDNRFDVLEEGIDRRFESIDRRFELIDKKFNWVIGLIFSCWITLF